MKIGVYFCKCGSNISDKINADKVREGLSSVSGDLHFTTVDFICSEEGKAFLEKDVTERGIERVVIAACSPREHENTFMRVLAKTGVNPYLLQMVNVREQVAWVTADKAQATSKALRYINAAIKRVSLHDPLVKREIEACPDVLIIGGGPAGLKAALCIAEAGRKAIVVEKSPVIGGMPVRYEELFPTMECGSCMLEPVLGDVLHGENAGNIELLTMSEVEEIVGYYGSFSAKIRRRPRFVDTEKCIGCLECIGPCPVMAKNVFNYGLNERKAISLPFNGALPNVPFIDDTLCIRMKGEDCRLCKEACPVEDAFRFDDRASVVERNVGAIVVAIGADVYDCRNIPSLGYGALTDVYSSAEFERLLASNGPTDGALRTSAGEKPATIAIIHCVGSLDKNHKEYCSGICCQYAFKYNHLIEKKLPGTTICHLFKEIAVPGKQEFTLYAQAKKNPSSSFIRYENIGDLHVSTGDGKKIIGHQDSGGVQGALQADIVVLCPAMISSDGAGDIGGVLGIPRDTSGFFEEMHGRLDATQSKIKGIYLAGTCQSPMDIQEAMSQGVAAAGSILSGLATGKKLEVQPMSAVVDADRCSGCRICVSVCPYKAVSFDAQKEVAWVNDVLCQACGACVAACPSATMSGWHFTDREILAEIREVLQ